MPVTDRKKVPSQVPSSGVKKCTREAALANRSKGANTDDSAVSGAAAAIAISNGCPLPGSQAAVAAKKAKAAARRELIKFVYTSRCIYTSCCINIYFKKNNNHSHNSPGPPSRLKFPTGSPPPPPSHNHTIYESSIFVRFSQSRLSQANNCYTCKYIGSLNLRQA